MNIFKHILCFVLSLSTGLISMEAPSNIDSGILDPGKTFDKNGAPVILEWHKIKDIETLTRVLAPVIPMLAEAFADESVLLRKFLFDERLQRIKPEYTELLNELPSQIREMIDEHIQLGGKDVKTRFDATLKSYQKLGAKWAPAKPFVVIAKEGGKILGAAVFCCESLEPGLELPRNAVYLDELGVIPAARERGLARLLVFSAFKLVKDANQIFLDTGMWNTRAQAAYDRLGFSRRACAECGYVGFVFTKTLGN